MVKELLIEFGIGVTGALFLAGSILWFMHLFS